MEIAPKFSSKDWQKLQLDEADSPDWVTAISVLNDRISARYLTPADLLIASENNKIPSQCRFGFTVLAIDSLLVETLEAFLLGLLHTKNRSREMFRLFLTSRKGFSEFFDEQLADDFFEDFRCGILHQAEISRNSRVWSVGKLVVVEKNGIRVNRNEFHKRLKGEFKLYLEELSDPANTELRKNFQKKMNHIARAEI